MSRKDYEAIAGAFSATSKDRHRFPREVWEELRTRIAEILASGNPRFSRERFYTATEKEHEV